MRDSLNKINTVKMNPSSVQMEIPAAGYFAPSDRDSLIEINVLFHLFPNEINNAPYQSTQV